jgi:phage I-like protein
VTLSQGQYDELVANGEAGKAALAQIDAQRRDGIITTALSEGRLAPADQATWRAQLDKDEAGTVALLATLAAGTVPVTPIGHAHAAAGDPLDAEWDAFAKTFTQEV